MIVDHHQHCQQKWLSWKYAKEAKPIQVVVVVVVEEEEEEEEGIHVITSMTRFYPSKLKCFVVLAKFLNTKQPNTVKASSLWSS
ncbi:hypothetical protein T4B_13208 [Trichinella pseudospiralis]|uniref:Uncharacterized protein n=1 Tax=Trichinella pseudospiralis TaxID=6337 RepID=A0A0V1IW26_TRIPS|nr:hypothetical protein T4B_13208 [Trichinella pseudospiralis]KRZ40332.1 hypothetical protein T4C_3693 [Trichinella pseudospiralis]